MTGRLSILALGAAAALSAVVAASPVHAANSCVIGAKDDYKEAKANCKEDLQVAKDACLNRDHDCVEACRADRDDCRTASGIDAAIAACQAALQTAIQNCKVAFGPGTPERATCIDDAQVTAFQCRDQAREDNKAELKACRKNFKLCVKPCGPAVPAIDTKLCRDNAKADYVTCNANAKEDYRVAQDICRHVSHSCAEACRVTRDTCIDPFQTTLDAAIAACNATRDAAIANCNGDAACIDQVQVVAFQCRDQAREDAHPGIASCRTDFNTCIHGCPSSPSGAFLD